MLLPDPSISSTMKSFPGQGWSSVSRLGISHPNSIVSLMSFSAQEIVAEVVTG